jgi:menaquinone-dependent protoporphyrinogen oxidase
MPANILIAYASKHGATAEVAEAIGDALTAPDVEVAVLPVSEVDDLSPYTAAVVGSPIYSSDWLPEATTFVKRHSRALGALPAACFVLAIRLRDGSEAIRETVERYITTERVIMQPVSVGYFAGRLDYDLLSPITRLQVQTKGLPAGDFRDWDAIRAWAADLRAPLLAKAGAGRDL